MSKQSLNGNLSIPAETSRYPAALQIALEQLAAAFREHGQAALARLFEDKEGYPKVIVALEKLCKCAVEFEQLHEETTKATPGIKGISKETDSELTRKLQGL